MRANVQATNPDEIEVTITLTAPLKEWQMVYDKLDAGVKATNNHPATIYDLQVHIYNAIKRFNQQIVLVETEKEDER